MPGLKAGPGGSPPAIKTTGLTRRFDTVTAVDGLSLEIAPGTIFGFLGPNGAGKTTTIRLLLGLIEPSSGAAEVLGLDVAGEGSEVRRRSGVLLEHHGLYERLSAQDNLEYFGRLWHLERGERQRRISELVEHFGLGDRRTDVVGTWSRGMKQKLAIARALLHRPRLVFLDEPTAGLDPVAAVSLRHDLAVLAQREGTTVFITTHNLDEAQRMCDQVGVINLGQLVAIGSPDALRRGRGQRVEIVGRGFRPDVLARLRAHPSVESIEADQDCAGGVEPGHSTAEDVDSARAGAAGAVSAPNGAGGAGSVPAGAGRMVLALAPGHPVAPVVRLLVEGGADIEEVVKGAPSLESAFLALLAANPTAVPDPDDGQPNTATGA